MILINDIYWVEENLILVCETIIFLNPNETFIRSKNKGVEKHQEVKKI